MFPVMGPFLVFIPMGDFYLPWPCASSDPSGSWQHLLASFLWLAPIPLSQSFGVWALLWKGHVFTNGRST